MKMLSRISLNQGLTLLAILLLFGCAGGPTQESTGQYVDDTVITTKVKAAILNAPDLSAAAVNVETYKGIVQLSGFVDSEAKRDRAAVVAGGVEGVRRVENNITVKPRTAQSG